MTLSALVIYERDGARERERERERRLFNISIAIDGTKATSHRIASHRMELRALARRQVEMIREHGADCEWEGALGVAVG